MPQYDLAPNMLIETVDYLDSVEVEKARERIKTKADPQAEFLKICKKNGWAVVSISERAPIDLVTLPRADFQALVDAANMVADGVPPTDRVQVNVIQDPVAAAEAAVLAEAVAASK